MAKLLLLASTLGMLIALTTNAQEVQDRPNDTFYERRTVEESKPIQLPYVREADVLWSKRIWQNIDLRQTINQPLYFPQEPTGNYRNLMTILEEAIRSGEIRVYGVDDDNFRHDPLDPDELFNRLSRTETFPDADGEIVSVEIEFNPGQVLRFRIMEDWFIDKRRSKLDVRIIGLSPSRQAIDPQTGEFLGWESLFWVPYAEIRELLAGAPVYTRNNDMQQISFDDFFIRRFFDATVYREDRPDALVISEYIDDPIEQLLEGQRIKEEIRNKEMDLWHY